MLLVHVNTLGYYTVNERASLYTFRIIRHGIVYWILTSSIRQYTKSELTEETLRTEKWERTSEESTLS